MDRETEQGIEWDVQKTLRQYYHYVDQREYEKATALFTPDVDWEVMVLRVGSHENMLEALQNSLGSDTIRHVLTNTVVTVIETNRGDENYQLLIENFRRLREMTDQDGRPLEVVELPMPRPLFFDGYRLPASYANFYVANQVVLVPTFNDPNDRTALGILGKLFPDRAVVGIHCVDLVWGFGTIHCSTQQQPKAKHQSPERE